FVERDEQIAARVRRFGLAQEQKPTRAEREMKRLEQSLLGRPVQVNQDIPTGHEIQMRKRRRPNSTAGPRKQPPPPGPPAPSTSTRRPRHRARSRQKDRGSGSPDASATAVSV